MSAPDWRAVLQQEHGKIIGKYAAQEAKVLARAEAKQKEDSAKSRRRDVRNTASRERTADRSASCCINWYCSSPGERARGMYQQTCRSCGKELVYQPFGRFGQTH